MRRIIAVVMMLGIAGLVAACVQQKPAATAGEREMTLGLVQKEIRSGMSQAEVAEAIGSPNIVTKDEKNLETWIYDKIGTEASYKEQGSYFTLIIFGFSGGSSTSTTTQRTLTVVIRYNAAGRVDKVTYHASKF